MLKIFAPLLLLLSLQSAQAEIFTVRGSGECTEPNQVISVRDFQNYLDSVPTLNGCDIYKTRFVESLSSVGLPIQEDGYDGPVLYVTVVRESLNPQDVAFDVILIRADKPLCLAKTADSSASLFYRMEYSVGGGPFDFLFGGKSVSQRITMNFSEGKLDMVSHEVVTTEGGVFQNRGQSLFQCGGRDPGISTIITP